MDDDDFGDNAPSGGKPPKKSVPTMGLTRPTKIGINKFSSIVQTKVVDKSKNAPALTQLVNNAIKADQQMWNNTAYNPEQKKRNSRLKRASRTAKCENDESTFGYLKKSHSVSHRKSIKARVVNKASSESLIDEDSFYGVSSRISKLSNTFSLMGAIRRSTMIQANNFEKLYGSEFQVEEDNSKLMKHKEFIIHPYSTLKLYFDLISIVMVLSNVVLVPYIVFFYADRHDDWCRWNTLFDAWFLLDIALSFRTGYTEAGIDGEVILDLAKIQSNYLRGWFILDLVAAVPFEVLLRIISSSSIVNQFITATQTNSSMNRLKILRIAKIFALVRIFRIGRMYRYLRMWEDIFQFTYDKFVTLFSAINRMLGITLFLHLFACMQYNPRILLLDACKCGDQANNATCPTPETSGGKDVIADNFPIDSWVRLKKIPPGAHYDPKAIGAPEGMEPFEKYQWAFFMSTSQMLCIGYGQFPPMTDCGMAFCMLTMALGAIIWAFLIGSVTNTLQSLDQDNTNFKEKLTQVQQYMQFRHLPHKLREEIEEYYALKFRGNLFEEATILSEVNPILRNEVIKYNCMRLLRACKMFEDVSDEFAFELICRFAFEIYQEGDKIIKEGMQGRRMYFISKGTVCIKSSRYRLQQIQSPGTCFGETCLLAPFSKRCASVFADDSCYLYAIATEDFVEVATNYPKDMQCVLKTARETLLAQPDKNVAPRKTGKMKRMKKKLEVLRTLARKQEHQDP